MLCRDPLITGCPLLWNNPQSETGYFYLFLGADLARWLSGREPLLLHCCRLLQRSWVLRIRRNFLHLWSLTQTGFCLCCRPCLPSLASLLVGRGPSLLPCCCCGCVCNDSPPTCSDSPCKHSLGAVSTPPCLGPSFPGPGFACAMPGLGFRALVWGPDIPSR